MNFITDKNDRMFFCDFCMDADINTPRGQVITIVGIVSSVAANLVLLMLIVLGGEWLISVLPENVMGAFNFVIITLLGALWMMRFDGKDGVIKGFLGYLPYIAAIGTDFDGIGGKREIDNVSEMPKLLPALEKGGFTATEIDKITRNNVLRVMKDCMVTSLF